jgi:16S rRNA processing protein RimM
MGRIGAPYGVKGWVHVESFTEPATELLNYRTWSLRAAGGERHERQVAEGRAQGAGLVARFEGIGDRDAAALLRGAMVEVPRAELPRAPRGQYYRADLVGLTVRNVEGVELGVLAHFVDAPAGAVMVVRGAKEHWVPATPVHIREVRLDEGVVVVDWPAELEERE